MNLNSLYIIADKEGTIVDCFDTGICESLSINQNGTCYIAINPIMLNSIADEKVKLAHELGHCCTGSFYNQYSPCDIIGRHERRADKWAIKKLIPKDELINAIKHGYVEIWQLAEHFEVTDDFMSKAIEYYKENELEQME